MGRFFNDQRGVGHIGIIVAVVVILAAGGVGWWVWQNQNKSPQQQAIRNAVCDYDDKDICKFFASWEATDSYSVESTTTVDGKTVTTLIEAEGSDKTHVVFSGDVAYETITIGNMLYTKAGDTWYKQTLDAAETEDYQGDVDTDFAEPTDGGKVSYIKIGTEKCGDLTCYKYQIVDTDSTGTTNYIWFDTKDYQVRRMQVVNADGTTYDSTFSYKKVSISEPSPVKELGENEYIVPGQSEPTTLPGAGDNGDFDEAELQRLLEQYQ